MIRKNLLSSLFALFLFSVTSTYIATSIATSQFAHANEKATETTTQNHQFNKSLSEAEFNELFLASLANDFNGVKLLSVSDAIDAKLFTDRIEVSAVINLEKVEKLSPKARATVEKFDALFFFLDKNQMNIKVIGEPVARNGSLGIRDNFSVELGPIPLSNDMLRQFGLEVQRANHTNLRLKDMYTQAIKLSEGRADLATKAAIKK